MLHKLEEKNLPPSPEADKETLLRRLNFDLTGLPPSLEEIKIFLNDKSDDAYEKQVDRLLASVHYGEKMATDWMDVARFSDTYGYQVDRYRNMSPWRDWVIKSFNDNMPYDQFLIQQIAGDLLPNATSDQILATGFNRLHAMNMEDGIIDEEFRVENVADRVAVLGEGVLGLTLACAKCHDHKYDPISQKEYYQLYSFFNNINETGQISWDYAVPPPTLELPTERQKVLISNLEQKINTQTEKLQEISEEEQNEIIKWIENRKDKNVKNQIPQKNLVAHFPLENNLTNRIQPHQKTKMNREYSPKETPTFAEGFKGQGLLLDGDAWLESDKVGIFKRSDAFSIGLWVNIPNELKEGVIFHKNKGTTLHSFRGFHLYLKNNKLEWVMSRTFPENAIFEISSKEILKEEWVHLMVSYDGSSSAEGTKIFINGVETETEALSDNLTRDIVFNDFEDVIYAGKVPSEKEIELLLELRAKEYKKFKANPQKAKGWLAAGQYQVDSSMDKNLIAANAVVASVILNADATIIKR